MHARSSTRERVWIYPKFHTVIPSNYKVLTVLFWLIRKWRYRHRSTTRVRHATYIGHVKHDTYSSYLLTWLGAIIPFRLTTRAYILCLNKIHMVWWTRQFSHHIRPTRQVAGRTGSIHDFHDYNWFNNVLLFWLTPSLSRNRLLHRIHKLRT